MESASVKPTQTRIRFPAAKKSVLMWTSIVRVWLLIQWQFQTFGIAHTVADFRSSNDERM